MAKKIAGAAHSVKCLKAIAAYVGGQANLAKKIGVTHDCVRKWVARNKISPKKALELSKILPGKFSVEELLGAKD